MARLDLDEWIPMSALPNLRTSAPIDTTAALILMIISEAVILKNFDPSW